MVHKPDQREQAMPTTNDEAKLTHVPKTEESKEVVEEIPKIEEASKTIEPKAPGSLKVPLNAMEAVRMLLIEMKDLNKLISGRETEPLAYDPGQMAIGGVFGPIPKLYEFMDPFLGPIATMEEKEIQKRIEKQRYYIHTLSFLISYKEKSK